MLKIQYNSHKTHSKKVNISLNEALDSQKIENE